MNKIKDIIPKSLAPGINGHYVHGNSMTFGVVELEAGSGVPLHSHVQEQITYILEGELDMIIDGRPCLLSAGMYHVIPSNILHSAVAITRCSLVDVFSPVREDYRSGN